MQSFEIREKFLDFFKQKGHKITASSSLIPKDKTVLLTSAGMQQFVPYLSGEKNIIDDFGTRHLASVQKCFRTPDIEEIGDDTHHTFFEMLGNWSIGEDPEKGYFKQNAIEMALEFFVNVLGLNKDKLWITIFKGEQGIPRDEESYAIWQEQGIPKQRIIDFGLEDNFWGPTAKTGPCGPCSEIHYDRGEEYGCKKSSCGPNCPDCKRFVELWNLVFMEYNKNKDSGFSKLPQRNVDTGIGLERLTSVLQKKDSAYETDIFSSLVQKLESFSGRKYADNKKTFRIICDHIRAGVFLLAEGILPSNTDRGYICRRLIRRTVKYSRDIELKSEDIIALISEVVEKFGSVYPEIVSEQNSIVSVFKEEEAKFNKTLEAGIKELEKILLGKEFNADEMGKKLFFVFQTYGFPLELSLEELKKKNKNILEQKQEITNSFYREIKKHQEISRAGAEKKFGGVEMPEKYNSARLHTATHLLHRALRIVLGENTKQMGSSINPEGFRFDFSYPNKLTGEQIKEIEGIVNEKIKECLDVRKQEMEYGEALKQGALAFFKEKYPERVNVFSIGDFSVSPAQIFSKEICAGPHVENTSQLKKFRIKKEESSSAGVRRIRAVLEE